MPVIETTTEWLSKDIMGFNHCNWYPEFFGRDMIRGGIDTVSD
jgi:hypothetical protein